MPTWYVVVGVALTILGFLLSLQGLWVSCRAIWPKRVLRAADRCRNNPIASILVGILVTGVAIVIGIVGQAGPIAKAVAGIAWIVYFFVAAVGLSGFVTHVGQRLASPIDDLSPWRATLRGGIALSLSWLVPIVGWFVLSTLSIVFGVGAMVLSFFGASRQSESGISITPPPLDLALSARMSGQNMPPEYRPVPSHEGALR